MSFGILVRDGFDKDALAYCTRSGASDRASMSAFVRSLKASGIWSNAVCWPLRSFQNAGAGTTAFSLGGLGEFSGTLINSPSWTANGVSMAATNRQIDLPDNAALYQARSGLAVFKTTSNAYNQTLVEYQDGTNGTSYYYLFKYSGQSGFGEAGIKLATTRAGAISTNINASRTINLSDFQCAAFTMDNASDSVFRNGSVEVGGARSGLSSLNASGARNTRMMFGNSTGLTGAFLMLSADKWSDSQVLNLYALYKATLGAGLGLP